MDNENLELPAPTLQAPGRFAPAPQLLIQMSEEHAARLLLRSLVEQVAQLATPAADAVEQATIARPAGWRDAIDRLDASLALYAGALDGSVPKKSRRKVRQLARRAARLDRREALLAWLLPFAEAVRSSDDATPGHDVFAARWLQDRIASRTADAGARLRNAQRDAAKLHALGKSLGVYTTSVRIDDMPRSQSFAALTAQLLRDESLLLSQHFDELELSSIRSAERLRASAQRIGYLLGPIRVHVAGAAAVAANVNTLHTTLERLAELGRISSAILRAGKRAGSAHMSAVLKRELYGSRNGDGASGSHDLRGGLVSLARVLHAEIAASFQHVRATWPRESIDALIRDIATCASLL